MSERADMAAGTSSALLSGLHGSALVAARKLYRAALSHGWELTDLDTVAGYVRSRSEDGSACLTARRVGSGAEWNAVVERWTTEQVAIGRRGDRCVVDRWRLVSSNWLRGADGSRRLMGGGEAFKALGSYVAGNPSRQLIAPTDREAAARIEESRA